MIFGRTNEEQAAFELKARVKRDLGDRPIRVFVIFPRQLRDGRYACLRDVWRIRLRHRSGRLSDFGPVEYFLSLQEAQARYDSWQEIVNRCN